MSTRQADVLIVVDAVCEAINVKLPEMLDKAVARYFANQRPTRVEDVPDNEEWLRDIAAAHLRRRADTHFIPSPNEKQP